MLQKVITKYATSVEVMLVERKCND